MSHRLQSSRRLHRMLQKQERRIPISLNLVSLIDVFTVLVFFLLLTSNSVQALRNPKAPELPNSITMSQPSDAPLLMVSTEDIKLQGRFIMSRADAERAPGLVIPQLEAELQQALLQRVNGGANADAQTRGEINIMADRTIPYSLLKKVMATCGEAQYARISLSVNHHGAMIP